MDHLRLKSLGYSCFISPSCDIMLVYVAHIVIASLIGGTSVLERRKSGGTEFWRDGILERRNSGNMEFWRDGILERRNSGGKAGS